MCGIAGAFAYSNGAGPMDSGRLLKIRDRMTVRGPDGSGLWMDPAGRVGLAHRRLSIIDLREIANQPMQTVDGRYRIVFNGEIYNYQELRRNLEREGVKFETESDTEVLLQLYRLKGQDMFDRVEGMYAFAIWDEVRGGMLLARDPFGIKPLYYSDDGSSLFFASQVQALLGDSAIDRSPAPEGHVGFFLLGYVPEPWTLYRGIRALKPGTSLWIGTDGDKRIREFCSIARIIEQGEREAFRGTANEKRELLVSAISDSVKKHLISDVPIGVFLSSGLDSASLAYLSAKEHQANGSSTVGTLTLGFDEFRQTPQDETPLAQDLSRQFGTKHFESWVTEQDFFDEVERVIQVMDQPSIDGINTYFVSRAAARAGWKVALSGLGGDELFQGYESFRHVPALASSLGWTRFVPGLGRGVRWASAPLVSHLTSPKYAGLLEYGATFEGAYLLRRSLFMPWELFGLMDRDFVIRGWENLNLLSGFSSTIAECRSDRAKVSALEIEWYMRSQLLRDADWAGMAHSVEIRVPFVDIKLLKTITSVLGSSSVEKREVMKDLVPEIPASILNRKKTGFGTPVSRWISKRTGNSERGLRGWAKFVYQRSQDGRGP